MKASLFILLPLALLAACTPSHNESKFHTIGDFTIDNGTNTVFWGTLNDASQQEVQYVIIASNVSEINCTSETHNNLTYDHATINMKKDSHQWYLEAIGNSQSGLESLTLSDATPASASSQPVITVLKMNLRQSKFWQLEENGTLKPIQNIAPALAETIHLEAVKSMKEIEKLRYAEN